MVSSMLIAGLHVDPKHCTGAIVQISAPHGDLILANWLACDYYFNSAPPSVQCPEHGLRNAASGGFGWVEDASSSRGT